MIEKTTMIEILIVIVEYNNLNKSALVGVLQRIEKGIVEVNKAVTPYEQVLPVVGVVSSTVTSGTNRGDNLGNVVLMVI